MNIRTFLAAAVLALFIAAPSLPAQEAVTGSALSADSTVITADAFRLDQLQHQGVFSGNVVVTSKNFRLQSRDLTIFFSPGAVPASAPSSSPAAVPGAAGSSKVQRLLASGDVQIVTQDRTATAVQADYDAASDKMVLTGSPQITQGKDVITGTTITLYRSTNKLEVDGRSRVVLNGGLPSGPAK